MRTPLAIVTGGSRAGSGWKPPGSSAALAIGW